MYIPSCRVVSLRHPDMLAASWARCCASNCCAPLLIISKYLNSIFCSTMLPRISNLHRSGSVLTARANETMVTEVQASNLLQ
jgi:hypothetical protein